MSKYEFKLPTQLKQLWNGPAILHHNNSVESFTTLFKLTPSSSIIQEDEQTFELMQNIQKENKKLHKLKLKIQYQEEFTGILDNNILKLNQNFERLKRFALKNGNNQ
ncbi:Hypothetical_protein [Hexamita inflata]|uniref:Hypothetical_protein n=1 Tax=Hexamita inflata TaxID=28002 RepID=A0AA86PYW5_9EUKA|nr:Hypothetical protein HINF_LOCUS34028 [Hexamita inflata]